MISNLFEEGLKEKESEEESKEESDKGSEERIIGSLNLLNIENDERKTFKMEKHIRF